MERLRGVRVRVGNCPSYHCTPISALYHIVTILEPRHEFVHYFCILLMLETSLFGARGEAKSRKGRSNDVEASCIEFRERFYYFLKRARPAM